MSENKVLSVRKKTFRFYCQVSGNNLHIYLKQNAVELHTTIQRSELFLIFFLKLLKDNCDIDGIFMGIQHAPFDRQIVDTRLLYYRPQTKLQKGYVFTPVSHSIHRRGFWGMSAPVHAGIHPRADTPPGQTPPSRHPPGRHPQQTATAADGTHPTGIHSCYFSIVATYFLTIMSYFVKRVHLFVTLSLVSTMLPPSTSKLRVYCLSPDKRMRLLKWKLILAFVLSGL